LGGYEHEWHARDTRAEEFDVRASDVMFIPAGEVHIHDATEDATMTHISALIRDDEIIDE